MDRLDVELSDGDDPEVRVKFERFRTLSRGEDTPCLSNWLTGSTTAPGYRALMKKASMSRYPAALAGATSSGSALSVIS